MSTWVTSTLGELCEISIGKTPARAERQYWGGDLPWLSIADMNQGRELHHTKEYVTEAAAAGPAGRLVPPGTLLLSFKLSVGKLGFTRIPMYTNEAIAALPVKDPSLVDSGFLYWALRRTDLLRNADDAAMGKNLNKKKLASVEVPLPSLAEQRRIAAVLDQADSLRTKRRAAITLLDDLAQSIFLDMFTGDDRPWPVIAVEELCSVVVDCVNRTAPVVEDVTPYKMIRTTNVRNGRIDLNDVRYVNQETFVLWNRRTTPQRGDVVFTREAPVGETGIIETDEHVFLGQRLMLYRPHPDRATAAYLAAALMSPPLRAQYEQAGSGSTVKHLSLPTCRGLKVPAPPVGTQRDFQNRMAKIQAEKARHQAQLALLDELFDSLQQRAFSGSLWNDESAE